MILDGTPIGAARLAGNLSDCGARSERCVVQVGASPPSSLVPQREFFTGTIHTLRVYPGVGLLTWPTASIATQVAARALLPATFGSARPTCLVHEGHVADVDIVLAVTVPYRSYLFQVREPILFLLRK